MPQLRIGARRSKRLGDLQPATQPIDPTENIIAPTRTRRKTGGGRGRGAAAGLAKGLVAATTGRPATGGRGRGVRLIDLDQEPPCEIVPDPEALGVGEPVLNRAEGIADKDIAMEGGSGDKIIGVKEEGNTPAVPERVQVGNSPVYKTERKLGKGGFGQVYVGRRVRGGTERIGPDAVEVALKLSVVTIRGATTVLLHFEWMLWNSRGSPQGTARRLLHSANMRRQRR